MKNITVQDVDECADPDPGYRTILTPVPKFIDPVFANSSPKREYSMTKNKFFGLVFTKTVSGSATLPTEVLRIRSEFSIGSSISHIYEYCPCIVSIPHAGKHEVHIWVPVLWIRICIRVKSRIRIRIKGMRIRIQTQIRSVYFGTAALTSSIGNNSVADPDPR